MAASRPTLISFKKAKNGVAIDCRNINKKTKVTYDDLDEFLTDTLGVDIKEVKAVVFNDCVRYIIVQFTSRELAEQVYDKLYTRPEWPKFKVQVSGVWCDQGPITATVSNVNPDITLDDIKAELSAWCTVQRGQRIRAGKKRPYLTGNWMLDIVLTDQQGHVPEYVRPTCMDGAPWHVKYNGQPRACFYCKEQGHIVKDCKEKREVDERRKERTRLESARALEASRRASNRSRKKTQEEKEGEVLTFDLTASGQAGPSGLASAPLNLRPPRQALTYRSAGRQQQDGKQQEEEEEDEKEEEEMSQNLLDTQPSSSGAARPTAAHFFNSVITAPKTPTLSGVRPLSSTPKAASRPAAVAGDDWDALSRPSQLVPGNQLQHAEWQQKRQPRHSVSEGDDSFNFSPIVDTFGNPHQLMGTKRKPSDEADTPGKAARSDQEADSSHYSTADEDTLTGHHQHPGDRTMTHSSSSGSSTASMQQEEEEEEVFSRDVTGETFHP